MKSRSTGFLKWTAGISILLFIFTIHTNAQVNVAKNGGFESSDTGAVVYGQGWLALGGADFKVVDDTVRNGSRAMKVTLDTLAANAWSIQLIADSIEVEPGIQYQYSIWARAKNAGAKVNLTVGNYSYSEYSSKYSVALTTEWAEYTLKFTVNDGETFVRAPIHLSISGNEQNPIYFDDLSVKRVIEETEALNYNGGLEYSEPDTATSTSISGWYLGGTDYADFIVVNDSVHSGSRALKAEINTAPSNSWSIQVVSENIDVTPGDKYKVSVWMKSETAGASMNFTAGNYVYQEYASKYGVSLSTEWTEYTLQFTISDDSTSARVPIHLGASANVGNTIYIDDLIVTEIIDTTLYYKPVIVEAEDGELGSEFATGEDGDVTYIQVTTDGSEVGESGVFDCPGDSARANTYEVTFPDAGEYSLYIRIKVGSSTFDDDSFTYTDSLGTYDPTDPTHWNIANGLASAGYSNETDVVYTAGGLGAGVWKWVKISGNTFLDSGVTYTVTNPDSLTQKFQLGGREDGLLIDKIAFGRSDLYYTVANLDNVEMGSVEYPIDEYEGPPLADGADKFLGNIYSSAQADNFAAYWNQVIPENAGKWASVEGTQDQMNWSELDASYDLAKDNGYPFMFHVLVWGAQQPSWMTDSSLTSEEQLAQIQEWYEAVNDRYDDIDFLQVVNEPLHQKPAYKAALGGDGETGWDWLIEAFQMARDIFPASTKLMINDYGIIGNVSSTRSYLTLIRLLQEQNLIDAIGVQGHAFTTSSTTANIMKTCLDSLAATGLPIYVTELEVDGVDDDVQKTEYQRIFPTIWEHSDVKGVTLWGWRHGLWREDEGAYLINSDGTERPSLEWLRDYIDNYITDVDEPGAVATEFNLYNNYPNPFNPSTRIKYSVPSNVHVTLKVFDILGREVSTLVDKEQASGIYEIQFNAFNLSSGIYFYRLQAGDNVATKKLMLLK